MGLDINGAFTPETPLHWPQCRVWKNYVEAALRLPSYRLRGPGGYGRRLGYLGVPDYFNYRAVDFQPIPLRFGMDPTDLQTRKYPYLDLGDPNKYILQLM